MYCHDGKVCIEKTMDHTIFPSMLHEIHTAFHDKSAIVAHWRGATFGGRTIDNAHPFFVVDNELAFCHNGTIHQIPILSGMNDTRSFNELVLKEIPTSSLFSNGVLDLISHYVKNDKLVFMNNKGRVITINEDLGLTENGVWFSNTMYQGWKQLFQERADAQWWEENAYKEEEPKEEEVDLLDRCCWFCTVTERSAIQEGVGPLEYVPLGDGTEVSSCQYCKDTQLITRHPPWRK
jgi:predicted glutamine amidotransferase